MVNYESLLSLSLSLAGTTPEPSTPAPPPPEAQPVETKIPEEEMDVTDDDITAGRIIKHSLVYLMNPV